MDAQKFNELLKKIKKDTRAVEEIYNEYYKRLMAHVDRRFGNLVDSRDIAHDIFLKLMTLKDQDFIEYPTSWLYRLADHYVIDKLRLKHTEVSFYDFLIKEFDLDRTITAEDIKRAMGHLDKASQEILYLSFWEGYKLYEVSKELNISYANVRAKASKAYQILKKFL